MKTPNVENVEIAKSEFRILLTQNVEYLVRGGTPLGTCTHKSCLGRAKSVLSMWNIIK